MADIATSTIDDLRASGQVADAWFNLLLKLFLTLVVAFALFWPDLFPIIGRFTDNLVDVEFSGFKVHFDQNLKKALEKRGIEVRDGSIFVDGRDIVQVAGDKARLEAQIKLLSDDNAKLQASLATQTDLLEKARLQLNGTTGADLGGIKSEIAAAAVAVGNVVTQSQAAVAQAVKTTKEVSQPSAGAALPAVGYALVFSSDTNPDDAMNEVRKAPSVTGNPIIIYHRRGLLASAAYFGTKDAALNALPAFVKEWPKNGPFIVSIANWCPQPTLLKAATPTTPEEKNCGF